MTEFILVHFFNETSYFNKGERAEEGQLTSHLHRILWYAYGQQIIP